jgi:hypothetical protein
MASTYTNLGVELMATGENAGTWGTKTNANLNLAEQLLGGFKIQTLNAAGTGANTTALAVDDGALTGAAQNRIIILGAVSPQAITGNKIVTFPLLTETFYFIKNSTSGAYTVQLKAASGSGATVTFSATDKGYKAVYLDGVATNTGVIEIPLSTADAVTLTGTQTLTNKTLTSPKIGTNILDVNGLELLNLTATGSAVNELTLANASTGNNPILSATGGDTNVGITLTPKGSGEVVIGTGAAAATLTSSGAHDLTLDTNGGTNSGVISIVDGAGGNITITPNGSGKIVLDGISFPNADGSADQILTTNGSGVLSFVDNSGGTDWQAVKTGNFTAAAGQGVFCNTTSGAFTLTLPSSPSIGDEVSFVDYAGTFDSNALTIGRNSQKIQGAAADLTVSVERAANTLVYTDGTQGWLLKAK